MGRPGKFFDQDAEDDPPVPDAWGAPLRAGRDVLFDQDASMELPRLDPMTAARYERELERRRRPPPERSALPSGIVTPPPPAPPVRITSRAAPLYPAPAPPGRGPAPRPPAERAPAAAPSTGRATAILAFGTFASRLTGFVRVLVVGYVLGVGVLSDAFNYANGVPNIVYDLLIGGILSATLIPVFVELMAADDRAESSRGLSAVLTAISLALVAVSALLWVAAPAVIDFYLLLSPHSTGGAERALATRLLRWFSPQVFFLGTTVASTAVLNARRRFGAAAVSPVINNVIAIAALLATKVAADHVLGRRGLSPAASLQGFSRDSKAVVILGLGTTIGYAVQLLVQMPAMHAMGLHLRPVWNLRHPAVRRVAGLSFWLLGVVLANQASLALVMILAGRTDGGVTAYQFSYQFFQLPYALIAVSVASAIMPDLSEHWADRNRVAFERQFVTGLRVTLAVLVPVAVVYAAVAGPFIELAIHHGAVGQSGARLVTRTLVYFVVGLPGFSAFFLLMRAFQAMQDARTMFRIYLMENAMTVVAAAALSPLLGVPGLALAWAGPYTVASVYAVARLRRRVGNLGGWLTLRALFRVAVATALAGAATFGLGVPLAALHGDALLLVRLILQAGAGAAVYVWVGRLIGIRELRPVMAMAGRVAGRR